MEHVTRSQLAVVQVQRLNAEARRCTDVERLNAIGDEMEVILDSLLAIREEQLLEELNDGKKSKRRRWWRRKES